MTVKVIIFAVAFIFELIMFIKMKKAYQLLIALLALAMGISVFLNLSPSAARIYFYAEIAVFAVIIILIIADRRKQANKLYEELKNKNEE